MDIDRVKITREPAPITEVRFFSRSLSGMSIVFHASGRVSGNGEIINDAKPHEIETFARGLLALATQMENTHE